MAINIKDWNKHYKWPTVKVLQYLVENHKTNGFHGVIRRVGKQILLEESDLFAWRVKYLPKINIIRKEHLFFKWVEENRPVAQLVEYHTHSAGVDGSSPSRSTI